jgi:WD repeat-containing protein 23
MLFNHLITQIWSLDGRIVEVLDRSKTLPASFSPSGPEPEATSGTSANICVRDVSWHSQVRTSGLFMGFEAKLIMIHNFRNL